jgi:hypothetical protein
LPIKTSRYLLVLAATTETRRNERRNEREKNEQIETKLVQDDKVQGQVEVHESLKEVESEQDQEETVQVQTENEITRDQDRDNQAEEEVEEEQAEGGTDREEAQGGTAGEEIEEVIGKCCRAGETPRGDEHIGQFSLIATSSR